MFINHLFVYIFCRNFPPTLEQKPRLDYLNAVIAESMRKSTVVSSGVPHFVEEDLMVMGYFFPKGTNVMASLTTIHNDPEIWGPDVEDFNPQRFLDSGTGKFQANDNLIPFSVGKRFCLGKNLAEQEFFLFFANLMHQFQFEAVVESQKELPSIKFSDDDFNTAFLRYPPQYEVILRPRL